MKTVTIILSLILFVIFSTINAQEKESGGKFKSEGYSFTTKNLYPQLKQTDISAIRLSVRTIHCKNQQYKYIFYPDKKEGDNTSLFDLLLWAIKEKGLTAYSPNEYSEFDAPMSWNEIESSYFSKDTIEVMDPATGEYKKVLQDKYNFTDVDSYLLLESTIFGINNTVLATRPIGLCPVHHWIREEVGDTMKRKLFWVYYPDIMDMLSRHSPAVAVKGIKNTNDFFVKNMYKGDIFPYYHLYSGIIEEWVWGDTSNAVKDGFNVSWLYNRIKDGVYYPILNTFYQGNPELKSEYNFTDQAEPLLNINVIWCSRYVYKTIDMRHVENYPLYFPETPFRGQKSLIDLIFEGIGKGEITTYSYESGESSFSTPITTNEIEYNMGKIADTVYVEDPSTGESVYKVVESEINSSEVKKYIIKEVEFLDAAGKCLISKPIALYPIRECKRSSYFEETATVSKIVCCIPFADKGFKKIINRNFVYMFNGSDFDTYSNFFAKRKYTVKKTETWPVAISSAVNEFQFPSVPSRMTIYKQPEISDITPEKGNIVFRKISIKDTANYQLFYPELRMNGLKSFADWLYYGFGTSSFMAYEYNTDGNFDKQLSIDDIKVSFDVINDTIMVEDVNTAELVTKIVPGEFNPNEVRSYILKELVINKKVIICGISPIREIIFYDWASESSEGVLKLKNTLWVPFSKDLLKAMSQQEIYRGNCEPGKTFYEFFNCGKYKGDIMFQKEVTAEEVKKILETLD